MFNNDCMPRVVYYHVLWCSELFGEVGVGINFDKYEDIPVEATGEGCPMHINNVSRISSLFYVNVSVQTCF